MATATLQTVTLCERQVLARESVDSENGVIKGVLAVGLKSRNTGRTLGLDRREFGDAIDQPYEYSEEALKQAAPLYEGVAVRVDHTTFRRGPKGERIAEGNRSVDSVLGELRDVRFAEGRGLVADLHYLTTHDLAPRLVEVAQRMPDKLALSHDASGKPELIGGRIVITNIPTVDSVDLIGDKPGTTRGLFESEDTQMKRTIKAICESAADNVIAARLLEMGGDVMGDEIAVEEMDEAGQVEAALESILVGILRGDGSSEEKLTKIKTALKFQNEITSTSDTTEGETETESESDSEDETKVEERFTKLESGLSEIKSLVEKLAPQRPNPGAKRLVESTDSRSYDEQAKSLFRKGA